MQAIAGTAKARAWFSLLELTFKPAYAFGKKYIKYHLHFSITKQITPIVAGVI